MNIKRDTDQTRGNLIKNVSRLRIVLNIILSPSPLEYMIFFKYMYKFKPHCFQMRMTKWYTITENSDTPCQRFPTKLRLILHFFPSWMWDAVCWLSIFSCLLFICVWDRLFLMVNLLPKYILCWATLNLYNLKHTFIPQFHNTYSYATRK